MSHDEETDIKSERKNKQQSSDSHFVNFAKGINKIEVAQNSQVLSFFS